MTTATAGSEATATALRYVLHQQGIGGRARAIRNRMVLRVAGVCCLAVGLSIVQVWSRIEVLELRYALNDAQQRIQATEEQIHRLDLHLAAMTAPERLERAARDLLGLQLPGPGQIVFVQESGDGTSDTVAPGGQ